MCFPRRLALIEWEGTCISTMIELFSVYQLIRMWKLGGPLSNVLLFTAFIFF
jgi:hypothetical protein